MGPPDRTVGAKEEKPGGAGRAVVLQLKGQDVEGKEGLLSWIPSLGIPLLSQPSLAF